MTVAVEHEQRLRAAELVRRYLARTVTLDVVFEEFGGSDDQLIQLILFALAHEPRRGFLGVGDRVWRRDYREPLQDLLTELEKGSSGVIPDERPVPRVRRRHVVGWALFTLWAAAGAAENGQELWHLISTEASFPLWRALLRSLAAAVLTLAAITGFQAARYRFHLYRTRMTFHL